MIRKRIPKGSPSGKGGQFAPDPQSDQIASTTQLKVADAVYSSIDQDSGRRTPGLPPKAPDEVKQIEYDTKIIKNSRSYRLQRKRRIVGEAKQKYNKERAANLQRKRFSKDVVRINKRIVAAKRRGRDTTSLETTRSRLCKKHEKHLWHGGGEVAIRTCRVCGMFSDREKAPKNKQGHYRRGVSLLERDGIEYVHDGAGNKYPVAVTHGGRYSTYLDEMQVAASHKGIHPMELLQQWTDSETSEPPWQAKDN